MPDEIKWALREYQGTEVFKYNAADHPNNLDPEKLVPVRQKDGLVAGDRILVAGIMGGYHLMTVEADEAGGLCGVNGTILAILDFGQDDRECWVCSGLVNTRGLAKLRITT